MLEICDSSNFLRPTICCHKISYYIPEWHPSQEKVGQTRPDLPFFLAFFQPPKKHLPFPENRWAPPLSADPPSPLGEEHFEKKFQREMEGAKSDGHATWRLQQGVGVFRQAKLGKVVFFFFLILVLWFEGFNLEFIMLFFW